MKAKKDEIDEKSKFLRELLTHYTYWINKNPTYAQAYLTLINAFSQPDGPENE